MRNVAYIFGIVGLILQCSEASSKFGDCNYWGGSCNLCLANDCIWCAVDFKGNRINGVGICREDDTSCPISEIIGSDNPSTSDSFTPIRVDAGANCAIPAQTVPQQTLAVGDCGKCKKFNDHKDCLYADRRHRVSDDCQNSDQFHWCQLTDSTDNTIGYLCSENCDDLIDESNKPEITINVESVTCKETCEVQNNCGACNDHKGCTWCHLYYKNSGTHIGMCTHWTEDSTEMLCALSDNQQSNLLPLNDPYCDTEVLSIKDTNCNTCKAHATSSKWCHLIKSIFPVPVNRMFKGYRFRFKGRPRRKFQGSKISIGNVCTDDCADFAYEKYITSDEVDCEAMCNSKSSCATCSANSGCKWCVFTSNNQNIVPFEICTAESSCLQPLPISGHSFKIDDNGCSVVKDLALEDIVP